MPGLIPLILIIVPIVEIACSFKSGQWPGWTLLIILATAMLGARNPPPGLIPGTRASTNGVRPATRRRDSAWRAYSYRRHYLADAGLLTDALGFLLLFPVTRLLYLNWRRASFSEALFRFQHAARNAQTLGCKNYRRRLSR